MREMAVNEFRSTLKTAVEAVLRDHEPLRVTRRAGEAFVVISAEDWEQVQETLYVLQNRSLMQQISRSLLTHEHGAGYTPPQELLDHACDNL
jgi:antitoxin YefM